MTTDHKLVYLEKYSPIAKRIIYETQELAETLHHQYIVPTHLAITIASNMDQDILNGKMKCKNQPIFKEVLRENFFDYYNDNFQKVYRSEMLRLLPITEHAEKPYLHDLMLQIMSFAEDKEKITAKVLITELILHAQSRERRLEMRRK